MIKMVISLVVVKFLFTIQSTRWKYESVMLFLHDVIIGEKVTLVNKAHHSKGGSRHEDNNTMESYLSLLRHSDYFTLHRGDIAIYSYMSYSSGSAFSLEQPHCLNIYIVQSLCHRQWCNFELIYWIRIHSEIQI